MEKNRWHFKRRKLALLAALALWATSARGYTLEELQEMALDHYEAQSPSGYRPPICDAQVNRDDSVSLHLYEIVQDGPQQSHTATSAWYFVDQESGIGTDLLGEMVDLSAFAEGRRGSQGAGDETIYDLAQVISKAPEEAARLLGFEQGRQLEAPSGQILLWTLGEGEGTSLYCEESRRWENGGYGLSIQDPRYYLGSLRVGAQEKDAIASLLNTGYTLEKKLERGSVKNLAFLAPSGAWLYVQFQKDTCIGWTRTAP